MEDLLLLETLARVPLVQKFRGQKVKHVIGQKRTTPSNQPPVELISFALLAHSPLLKLFHAGETSKFPLTPSKKFNDLLRSPKTANAAKERRTRPTTNTEDDKTELLNMLNLHLVITDRRSTSKLAS